MSGLFVLLLPCVLWPSASETREIMESSLPLQAEPPRLYPTGHARLTADAKLALSEPLSLTNLVFLLQGNINQYREGSFVCASIIFKNVTRLMVCLNFAPAQPTVSHPPRLDLRPRFSRLDLSYGLIFSPWLWSYAFYKTIILGLGIVGSDNRN